MEYQQKLLLVTAILVVVALYIAFTTGGVQPRPDSSEAEALLLKAASFGKGLGNYTYSYSEVSDGYKTTYTLTSSGDRRLMEIQNPLSTKKVYLLPNDTVFCISYPLNETCSSVYGSAEMENYIAFARSKFFNDTIIERAESSVAGLLNRSYLTMEPEIENTTVGGFDCRRVSYIIDYSNITVDEAGGYGIGSQSPKRYQLTRCIEPQSGLPYETTLAYSANGMEHMKITTVRSFSNTSAAIEPPANMSGDAVAVFRKEREQQVKLATCHTDKSGEEREGCVAAIALNLRRKDICELAGSRRDRCLVSIVPLTKDQTICTAIADASFKDDCYIELAGAYKDSSYCGNIKNASKVQDCQDAAKPRQPANGANETDGGNSTTSGVDIEKFMEYVDDYNDNQTAPADGNASTNQSG